jgi:hypothetical protein
MQYLVFAAGSVPARPKPVIVAGKDGKNWYFWPYLFPSLLANSFARFSSNTIKKSRASMMKVDCLGNNLRFEVFSSPDGPEKRKFEIVLFDQSKLDAKKEVGLRTSFLSATFTCVLFPIVCFVACD